VTAVALLGAGLEEAVDGAQAVLACVPGEASLAVAERAAPALAPGAVYADLATATPDTKRRAAAAVGDGYVDAAVLGAVAASGASVPILAAGPGARALEKLDLGLVLTVVDGPAGAAARVKLLRSVYLKGRDALVAEMMTAARRHGLDDTVAGSIAGPGEEVSFTELADRVLRSLALHADRRAGELEASVELLEADGPAPAARGAATSLRALAALGLRDSFGGHRPASGAEVLDRIRRSAE
jgi:3-hydroxyisobutyrate dehydrogenase-like beta-hydroxyacid dehydrogenase